MADFIPNSAILGTPGRSSARLQEPRWRLIGGRMAELLMNSAIRWADLFAGRPHNKKRHLVHSGTVPTNRRLRPKTMIVPVLLHSREPLR